MMHWTDKAKEELREYCKRLVQGDDPVEVAELYTDVQAHIEEELTAEGVAVADEDSVKHVLAVMGGEVEEYRSPKVSTLLNEDIQLEKKPGASLARSSKARFYLIFGGVVLPIIAVFFATVSGMSDDGPTPTGFHSLFILLTAFTVVLYLIESARETAVHSKWLALLVGFSLFITTYYAVLFIPMMPFGFIGILLMGLGLLILSPFFACICQFNILCRVRQFKLVAIGFVSAVLALLAVELPSVLTERAISQYVDGDSEERAEAIENLRHYGDEEILLQKCYWQSGRAGEMSVSWLKGLCFNQKTLTIEQAQTIFYQVTGSPYNEIEHENKKSRRASNLGQRDSNVGGDAVAGRQKGLAMSQSRMDVHIDNASKIGYAEWIVEFENKSHRNQEARMKFVLPHEGVISRVTLWIDGEEREAAYSSSSNVKAAYRSVVRANRDPVLVNMCAPNTFRLQCFPVLPQGSMKMKVGYNFEVGSHLKAPFILERNFEIKEKFTHDLFVQGKVNFPDYKDKVASFKDYNSFQEAFSFDGFQSQFVRMTSAKGADQIWCKDDVAGKYLIRSNSQETEEARRFTLVVDGSKRMAMWADTLKQLAEHQSIQRVIFAGDTAEEIKDLSEVNFVGGRDNVPALKKALLYQEDVIWLHAGQPCDFHTSAGLLQNLERGFSGAKLQSVCLVAGGNALLEKLWKVKRIGTSQVATSDQDLVELVNGLVKGSPKMSYQWQSEIPTVGTKVWDHLAHGAVFAETQKAWLNGEVPDALAKRAAQYQLITPVSGAVVLETKKQYEDAGLEPVDGSSSPKVPAVTPEPSSLLMLMLGGSVALMRRRRK